MVQWRNERMNDEWVSEWMNDFLKCQSIQLFKLIVDTIRVVTMFFVCSLYRTIANKLQQFLPHSSTRVVSSVHESCRTVRLHQSCRGLLVVVSVSAAVEARIVVQALRVNTLSKLTFADSKRFDALVNDIYPGVDFKGVEYAELADAFKEAAKEANLIVMETQVSAGTTPSPLSMLFVWTQLGLYLAQNQDWTIGRGEREFGALHAWP